MKASLLLLSGLLALTAVSAYAAPSVLSFDDIGVRPGTGWRAVGDTYTAEGFRVAATGPAYLPSAQFTVFDQGSPLWTGSPGLTLYAVGGKVTLTHGENSVFDFVSIDIARGDSNKNFVPVSFTGYLASGSEVRAVYYFSDQVSGRNERFILGEDFTGLSAVVWYQGAEWHQFDNITVVSKIPEPSLIALLLFSGLFLSFFSYKDHNS